MFSGSKLVVSTVDMVISFEGVWWFEGSRVYESSPDYKNISIRGTTLINIRVYVGMILVVRGWCTKVNVVSLLYNLCRVQSKPAIYSEIRGRKACILYGSCVQETVDTTRYNYITRTMIFIQRYRLFDPGF